MLTNIIKVKIGPVFGLVLRLVLRVVLGPTRVGERYRTVRFSPVSIQTVWYPTFLCGRVLVMSVAS